MDYAKLLNSKQYQAVCTNEQHVRVIAGAGSGKTRVLTYRISYLINELHVDSWKILAITFTNKVAKEMKERVLKINPEVGNKLYIQTYHSFCNRFLRSEIHNLGYNSNFSILDEEDQERLVKQIVSDDGRKKSDPIVKKTLNYICHHKCIGNYPEDITISARKFEDEEDCLKYYAEYESRIRNMNMVDFDDLLLKTKIILENFPNVRAKWQAKINHILIDEFQDTNDIQYKIVRLLKDPSCALFVVGDPDQTIYTWRGANQRIILDIDRHYDMTTVILNENYRSTQTILNVANTLIDKNKLRIKKDLFTENADGEEVCTHNAFRADDEANWVVGEILKLKNANPDFNFKDVAILYRANYLTLPFEKALMNKRIPYIIYGGIRFYQRREIKDVLAFFSLLVNKNDDIAFSRIINIPKRGIGDLTQEKIRKEAYEHNKSIYDYVLDWNEEDSEVKTKAIVELRILINKLEKTREELKENLEAYSSVLSRFIKKLGYFDYLSEDEETYEDRSKNVQSLFDDVQNFVKNNPESGFDEYLQNVSLLSAQDEMSDTESVSLMTVHTAKGLEFPYVFVISLNDGIFPSQKALFDNPFEGLEEERRLCYVAFTRAMKRLYVTANKEYSHTLQAQKVISRFFKEAGLTIKSPGGFSTFNDEDGFPKASIYAVNQGPKVEEKKYITKETETIDWKIGDILSHDSFGQGKVVALDGNLIIVDFEYHGRKTMVGNHIKLKLIKKGGYEA